MHKITYDQINETLYTEVLPNGLSVYLLPKAGMPSRALRRRAISFPLRTKFG